MDRAWLALTALGVFMKLYAHAVRRGAMLADAPRSRAAAAGAGVGLIQLLALLIGAFLSDCVQADFSERTAALLGVALGLCCGLPMLRAAWKDDRPEERRQQGLAPGRVVRYGLRMAPMSLSLGALQGWRVGHSPLAMALVALVAALGTASGLLVGMRRGYGSKRAAEWTGGAAWLLTAAMTALNWLK